MPGDFLGVVAQEIFVTQLGPDLVKPGCRNAGCCGQGACRGFAFGNQFVPVDRVFQAAAQCALGLVVQFLEELGLPGVPQFRIGPADIGNGEQVKVVQVDFVADQCRELADDRRVADVAFLGSQRQGQMVADQPGDQPGVIAAHSVLQHKGLGIQCAKFGMIAAAPLGDVMKQSGQVGEFGCRQCAHDFRAARKLVIVSGQGKTSQVADNEQRVLVDRVGMKEVVLHAADDAAKGGDVAAKHAIAVHAPQFVRYTFLGAQDLEKKPMVARVLSEPVIDEVQAAPYQ